MQRIQTDTGCNSFKRHVKMKPYSKKNGKTL